MNSLNSAIPSVLGFCTNLTFMALDTNSFIGELPLSLTKITELGLSGNSLSGSISPYFFSNWTELTSLQLQDNYFSREIPPEIGLLTKLQILCLFNNSLSDSIPSEVGNLKDLLEIDLSQNHLSGPIPVELGKLTQLQVLSLASNKLSGQIPTVLGNLRLLFSLNLNRNHLTGEIPRNLVSCTSSTVPENCESLLNKDLRNNYMNMVDLSNNRLSGNIAQDLARLSSLESLNLSHNQLSGEFPSSLSGMVSLSNISLDFSYNNLTGPIPTSSVFKDAPATAYVGNSVLLAAIVAGFITCYRKTKLLEQESRAIFECEEKAESMLAFLVRITDKCDVYSFGVVALEVMMGMHPRELLSSLSSSKSRRTMPIVESSEFLLKDVLDQGLPQPTGQIAQEIAFVVSIALQCVSATPELRPIMRFVAQELSVRIQACNSYPC
ncbi:hypothetical protein FH972_019642 [Carpinus fangiana]|uniref:non-specific serine/threonine protein kinase n=1 Tax=Carpinus fangiana TaxID=176857 RepID=A0A5N6RSZ4_9ROSI|nr:hypothetical protein FH972_019642 [Carpinus fangiana]